MRYLSSTLLILSTGLWLGGLVSLFLFAPAIFHAFGDDRATAGVATSSIFLVFTRFQLAAGGLALLGAFFCYMLDRRGIHMLIFTLLALCTCGALASSMFLVPRIEALRLAGESASASFKTLHAWSMIVYTTVAALLVVTVTLIPGALRNQARIEN